VTAFCDSWSASATNRNIWTDSYERDLRDVLALQREVTQDIVGEIRIKLTPQEQVQFGSVRPVNPEAYDHYFLARSVVSDSVIPSAK
jgi:hypothetical protein